MPHTVVAHFPHVGRGPGDHAAITLDFQAVQETAPLKRVLPKDSKAYDDFISDAVIFLTKVDQSNANNACHFIADAFDRHSITVQERPRTSWWTQACSDAKLAFRASRTEADKTRFYRTMKHARNAFFNKKVAEAAEAEDIWDLRLGNMEKSSR